MNSLRTLIRGGTGKALGMLGLAMAGILAAALISMLQGSLAETLSTSVFLILLALVLAVAMALVILVRIFLSVERIRENRFFAIEPYDGTNDRELIRLHRRAAKVVEAAPSGAEIFAVNSYIEVFADSSNPPAPEVLEAQRHYLRAFDTNPRRPIKIEEVEARLPISFVLIKTGRGGQIIWQTNKHAPSDGRPDAQTINGIYIVTDPEGRLVKDFLEKFRQLDRGRPYPLTKADLCEPAAHAQR